MKYEIVNHFPNDLIFTKGGPFVSLYQPTHRYFPENKKDPIVFKNLIRQIENSLKQQNTTDFIASIMKPFYELEGDVKFWNNTLDGIAVLASIDKCIVYNLYGTVEEFSVVAKSFHIKPLIKAFQSVESYQLLGLSRTGFSIYQGDKTGFSEIKIDSDVPRTIREVLGDQLTDSHIGDGSFGLKGKYAGYDGGGSAKEEVDKDTEKYFRYVDRFVFENYSKPSELPLILVSLKQYHSPFRTLSHNTYLIEDGVNISYDSLNLADLNTKALEVIRPINAKRIQKLIESYENAAGESLGSSDIVEVAKAAYESKVHTLLIEEDKVIPGRINYLTGEIDACDINRPDCDDMLDDLAELVLKNKGKVWVIPNDKMPGSSGIAAIYRYK